MPKVNLNNIRTGNRQVDRAISAARQAIANPAAASTIVQNELQNVINGIGNQIPGGADIIKKLPVNPQIQGELASLYGKSSKTMTPIVFPNDLDEDHYMLFKVKESRRLRKEDKRTIRDLRVIALPIPGNLQLQYSADYENASLGVAGGLIGGDVSFAELKKGAGSMISDITSQGKNILSDLGKGKASDATIGVGAVGAAVALGAAKSPVATAVLGGDIIGGAVKGMQKRAGLALNPHMAAIFTGVGFKDHSFNFKFVARNAEESNQIQAICKVFRQHMLPSYTYNKLAFKYPDEFEIQFSESLQPYLYKIGTCVLKSFNVTYNGQGVPQFYADTHAPIEVDIALGFQETHIETRNGGDGHTSGFGSAGDDLLAADQSARSEETVPMYMGED